MNGYFSWSFVNRTKFPATVTALGPYNITNFPDINNVLVPNARKQSFQFEVSDTMAAFVMEFSVNMNGRVIPMTGSAIMIPSAEIKTTSPSGYIAISSTPILFPDDSILCLTVEQSIDPPYNVPSGYVGRGVTGVVSIVYAPAD